MLEALKATWPCFDLESLIHPGTESWSTDWYMRGGPLQVKQHMGLGWCGWQCPEAETVHSRTTSGKCGCASFNGWDRQGSMCG